MKPKTYQLKLISLLENSISTFNNQLPTFETSINSIVINLLNEMQVDVKGNIINNKGNLNNLARIKVQLEKSVLSDKWVNSVKELLCVFNVVEELQNEYYVSLDPEFRHTPLLRTITSRAVDACLQSLTESGLQCQVFSKINDLLKHYIISQKSFTSLVKSMQLFLNSTEDKTGLLSRYVSEIVTDALNQYSASYSQTVAQDLGFNWFIYTGGLHATSHDWCAKMVIKKYIHISEFPEVLKGHFTDGDIEINPKTKLPYGMFDETNIENLPIKRGGHKCTHQLIPVHEIIVPEHIKGRLNMAQSIKAIKHYPNSVKVSITTIAQKMAETFGYSTDDLLLLAGGVPIKGSNVKYDIDYNEEYEYFCVKSYNMHYNIERKIYLQENYIENYLMNVIKTNRGTGLSLFMNQVRRARALGFQKMEVYAAQGAGWNGYITWAKFGYVMDASDDARFLKLMASSSRKEKTVFELVSTEDGANFWEDYGFPFNATFDLSDNSQSMKNLRCYLNRKGLSDD